MPSQTCTWAVFPLAKCQTFIIICDYKYQVDSHFTAIKGQYMLASTLVENWRVLLEQIITAMHLCC